MRIQSGDRVVRSPPPPPLENNKNIGFLSNTGPDPIKITKLPIQHSMLGHRRPASETPFKWRFTGVDGPLIVVFGSFLPLSNKKGKKRCQSWTPLTKLSGSAHVDVCWFVKPYSKKCDRLLGIHKMCGKQCGPRPMKRSAYFDLNCFKIRGQQING